MRDTDAGQECCTPPIAVPNSRMRPIQTTHSRHTSDVIRLQPISVWHCSFPACTLCDCSLPMSRSSRKTGAVVAPWNVFASVRSAFISANVCVYGIAGTRAGCPITKQWGYKQNRSACISTGRRYFWAEIPSLRRAAHVGATIFFFVFREKRTNRGAGH